MWFEFRCWVKMPTGSVRFCVFWKECCNRGAPSTHTDGNTSSWCEVSREVVKVISLRRWRNRVSVAMFRSPCVVPTDTLRNRTKSTNIRTRMLRWHTQSVGTSLWMRYRRTVRLLLLITLIYWSGSIRYINASQRYVGKLIILLCADGINNNNNNCTLCSEHIMTFEQVFVYFVPYDVAKLGVCGLEEGHCLMTAV